MTNTIKQCRFLSKVQYKEHMLCIFSMAALRCSNLLGQCSARGALTRLQTAPKAAGYGGPLCFSTSCLQSHASPCISSSSLDLCGHFSLLVGRFSRPVPLLCGSAAVCCLSYPVWTPPPWLLLCGPAFWSACAAVSCAWSNHVAPPTVTSHGSVKRQGPPSTHPPASPSQSRTLEQKNKGLILYLCLHYV